MCLFLTGIKLISKKLQCFRGRESSSSGEKDIPKDKRGKTKQMSKGKERGVGSLLKKPIMKGSKA